MKSNDYIKLPDNCYARLTDGTPCGLIFDVHHKPIGLFIAACGKAKWLTLEMIEQKRRENFGEKVGGVAEYGEESPTKQPKEFLVL